MINKTLLADQSTQSSGIFDKEDILKARIDEEIESMRNENIIKINIADEEFKLTTKGNSIVQFNYDTLNRYNFESIINWYKKLEEKQYDEYELIRSICENFDISIADEQIGDTSNIDREIAKKKMPDTEYSRSTIIILDYWCSNYNLDTISEKTGYDTTSMYHSVREISSIMEASEAILKDTTGIPKWYNTLQTRIKMGIVEDEVAFANLNGIGRYKLRKFRNWSKKIANQNNINEENLLEESEQIMKEAGKEKFIQSLSNSELSKGIGRKSAEKIANLLHNPDNKPQNSNSTNIGSKDKTLSDF
jgi:replicative superfamily II helicase